jgi:solute carrier family 45 protein 1/2/4
MIGGSVLVGISLIIMAWAKEFVGIFMSEGESAKDVTVVVAVLSIYAVDFAINAVQSCCRSLIVDTLPIPKQQLGSAWASRMVAVGHLVGYAAGTVDLVGIFGKSMGDTQLKKLVLVATFGLLFTVGLTSWAVTERVLISQRSSHAKNSGIRVVKRIISTTMHLPPRIQAICWAQFWAWIGWFPFLFYSSTWVGETYYRYDVPEDVSNSEDSLGDVGRIGSMALVAFSLVTFAGAFLLPIFVHSPEDEGFTPRPPNSMAKLLAKINKNKPDLLTAWFLGHFMFAGAMIMAPFASSFRFATVLVAFCGLPWVLGSWAPFAFMGIEVNKLSSGAQSLPSYRRLSVSHARPSNDFEMMRPESSGLHLDDGLEHHPHRLQEEEPVASTGELSGIYFGILNIYTTLPQFVGTFISMIVFSVLEPGKSPELAEDAKPEETHATDGVNAIAVCLFIGALSTLGAAYATWKLKMMMKEK